MARVRRRVCLQEGLHLDLNELARDGLIGRGIRSDPRSIQWRHPHAGKIASGTICADMTGAAEGWLLIRLGEWSQHIALVAQPRKFGGKQWYFVCPVTNRPVSVVWMPDGADKFCSRQTWGKEVAYLSQFGSGADRAHLGKARINLRLREGGRSDHPWALPSKPKGMRWTTYNRLVNVYRRHQRFLDYLGNPPKT
jgi:hypothetical protein